MIKIIIFAKKQVITMIDLPSCNECEYLGKSFFCGLSSPELENISDHKSHVLFKKNQIIFFEGNFPQGLYCIYEGRVKVSKLGEGGKEQIVRFAGRNELIGYRSLLSGECYFATATALEDTKVCFIPKNDFFSILKTNSDFSLKTIKLLTENLKQAEERVINMAQKTVIQRVAEAILILKECFGYEEDGKTINTTILRKEIASIAGTTTETTIRMITKLCEDKIIRSDNKKIVILDKARLLKVAAIFE